MQNFGTMPWLLSRHSMMSFGGLKNLTAFTNKRTPSQNLKTDIHYFNSNIDQPIIKHSTPEVVVTERPFFSYDDGNCISKPRLIGMLANGLMISVNTYHMNLLLVNLLTVSIKMIRTIKSSFKRNFRHILIQIEKGRPTLFLMRNLMFYS